MFNTVLIANRGEIAARIITTLRRLGIRSVVVHSSADAKMPFVQAADVAVLLEGSPGLVYRDVAAIIDVARQTGAEAIHPGYGFLSEDAGACRAIVDSGLVWIGPDADTIDVMGDKIRARNLAAQLGLPVAPGSSDPVPAAAAAAAIAAEIGFPVMVKAAAGGGGMGMQVAGTDQELAQAFAAVSGFAERAFSSSDVLIERYFPRVRHVEIQILGLADGSVVDLGERDCSVQRRNQKLAEESPAPGISAELRSAMRAAAVKLGTSIGYRSAGTVECLVDPLTEKFYFLEMNTRLQVEHPVTEAIYGVDLVEEQLRIAANAEPNFSALESVGHAIEVRVNAEALPHFIPRPGPIVRWQPPTGAGVRVDSGYGEGVEVTPFYDSLLCKLVVHGADRTQALVRLREAIDVFVIESAGTNLPFFQQLLTDLDYCTGDYDTGIVERILKNA